MEIDTKMFTYNMRLCGRKRKVKCLPLQTKSLIYLSFLHFIYTRPIELLLPGKTLCRQDL